jgi:hypothetical protein
MCATKWMKNVCRKIRLVATSEDCTTIGRKNMADFSTGRVYQKAEIYSISRKLKSRKSHMAESELKGRSGPSLPRTRFGPLRPFGPFLHLVPYNAENQAAESSKGRFEANSRKINFDPLCNIRPFDTFGLLKIRPRVFGQSSRSPDRVPILMTTCYILIFRARLILTSNFL